MEKIPGRKVKGAKGCLGGGTLRPTHVVDIQDLQQRVGGQQTATRTAPTTTRTREAIRRHRWRPLTGSSTLSEEEVQQKPSDPKMGRERKCGASVSCKTTSHEPASSDWFRKEKK